MTTWKNPQDEKPKVGRVVKILCKGKTYTGQYEPGDLRSCFGMDWTILEKDFPAGAIIEGWKETHEE